MTPLMLACRLGHESMTEMLVDVFGAELDPADKVQRETSLEFSLCAIVHSIDIYIRDSKEGCVSPRRSSFE